MKIDKKELKKKIEEYEEKPYRSINGFFAKAVNIRIKKRNDLVVCDVSLYWSCDGRMEKYLDVEYKLSKLI